MPDRIGKFKDYFITYLEAGSKLHLRPNLGVRPLNLILEILNIFLQLNSTARLDLESDLHF